MSVAALPYGLKLLWAPLVDTVYSPKWGRRLSWIYPCNFVACVLWLELSTCIDSLVARSLPEDPHSMVEPEELQPPSVAASASSGAALAQLSGRLLLIVWVMAVSDVAVDGWALTVRRNNLVKLWRYL